MAILVLPGIEKQLMNNVSVAANDSSSWVDIIFSSPVTCTTVMLDCPSEKGQLLTELSLDGSKWLKLNPNDPTFIDFGYSPTPFGSEWSRDAGCVMAINLLIHKRLRFKVVNEGTSSITANLWILGTTA